MDRRILAGESSSVARRVLGDFQFKMRTSLMPIWRLQIRHSHRQAAFGRRGAIPAETR